jgi:hypothetical protein
MQFAVGIRLLYVCTEFILTYTFSCHVDPVKVKVKLSLWLTKNHAMKMYWRSGGIAPHILDLGTRWGWVVSFKPQLLYPQGKSPWYPLDRRLGGPQSHSGHDGEQKNSQPLLGIGHQNPNYPAHSPVLYWLSYHGSIIMCILFPMKVRWSQSTQSY